MRYNNMHNGCTILLSTTGVLRRKSSDYDTLNNRTPKYAAGALDDVTLIFWFFLTSTAEKALVSR